MCQSLFAVLFIQFVKILKIKGEMKISSREDRQEKAIKMVVAGSQMEN
jgi:hypothetical protein